MELKSIGVIGAGTMGAGIAQICAMRSLKTIVYDLNQEALDKAPKQIPWDILRHIYPEQFQLGCP